MGAWTQNVVTFHRWHIRSQQTHAAAGIDDFGCRCSCESYVCGLASDHVSQFLSFADTVLEG